MKRRKGINRGKGKKRLKEEKDEKIKEEKDEKEERGKG